MERILIVEDDRSYLEFLKKMLESNGYDVDAASTSIEGLEYLARNDYQLLISDLNLEILDGIGLLQSALKIDPNLRTVILTANPSNATEFEALNFNADLYLVKEKGMDLILLYLRKLLNNKKSATVRKDLDLFSVSENIVLRLKSHEVYKDDTLIKLSPKEFDVLKLFLENKSLVLTRRQIIDAVWNSEKLLDTSRIVDVHIQKLRDKLNTFSIATVRGVGYKWNE